MRSHFTAFRASGFCRLLPHGDKPQSQSPQLASPRAFKAHAQPLPTRLLQRHPGSLAAGQPVLRAVWPLRICSRRPATIMRMKMATVSLELSLCVRHAEELALELQLPVPVRRARASSAGAAPTRLQTEARESATSRHDWHVLVWGGSGGAPARVARVQLPRQIMT